MFFYLERRVTRPAFCMKFCRAIDRAECHLLRQKHIPRTQRVCGENEKGGEISCKMQKKREYP